LSLTLDKVPKMIYPLVKDWAPDAYVVSFKLETDQSILISKSRASLEKYGHQLVIANILSTRKHHVVFVTLSSQDNVDLSEPEQLANVEIEEKMIPKLITLHSDFLQKAASLPSKKKQKTH